MPTAPEQVQPTNNNNNLLLQSKVPQRESALQAANR